MKSGRKSYVWVFASIAILLGAAAQAATIYQDAHNGGWTSSTTWRSVPSSGNDYVMDGSLGSPSTIRMYGGDNFGGNTLTIENNCKLLGKHYGGEIAQAQNGSGTIIFNEGAQLQLGSNWGGGARTPAAVLDCGNLVINGTTDMYTNGYVSEFLIDGTLTGAGNITLRPESTTGSKWTFGAVSNYTGTIAVHSGMTLDFNANATLGKLHLNSGGKLNLDRTLTFSTIVANGNPVAAGTYSGSTLASLNSSLGGTYFVDNGGTLTVQTTGAADPSKLNEVKVVDRDYLMIHFIDNEVVFVDDGLGSSAYGNNKHDSSKNYVVNYGLLDTAAATTATNWVITSSEDANYGTAGLNPIACSRKTKLSGAAQMGWDSSVSDWHYDYTFEHTIYLQLPHSLAQSKSYTLEVLPAINSTVTSQSFTFDIFNSRSEAVHVNLVGYLSDSSIKAADLHHWMGDGGARDYSSFVGNDVYLYNVDTAASQPVSTVALWKINDPSKEGHGRNLTGSDVWSADFTGFSTPGTYRVAIEGVGCSEDFEIKQDLYFEPFKISTLGFYYMRIGEDMSMSPVPRQPRYIPNVDPTNCKVYITTMQPWHPDWEKKVNNRKIHWDNADLWAPYVKAGSPENPDAWGGHSDALDWDRHLEHVSIIYDMLLPYILTGGRLPEDDLGILESGNGIPDIIDEARNEVDFWLRLRDGDGYSHGLTNPSDDNILYQAGNTPLAAWANAMNAAMLAESFRIAGLDTLKDHYTASAVEAYDYASGLADPWLSVTLNVGEGTFRGEDLKMTTAAYLYNLTGDTAYEDMLHSLCDITSNTSTVSDKGNRNQLYACVAYFTTPQTVNYPTLLSRMKASVIYEAKIKEANNIYTRPSRRATDPSTEWFKTIQNVQRCIVAHAVADSQADQDLFLDAMVLEADWGLGRNSGNMIYMTTATTSLANKRSIQNAYTSGWNDGTPGVHPGHTPYMNINDWASSGMIGNRPSLLAAMCYPDFKTYWPQDQSDFNNRFVWAHSEFTPQQTMRGKQALYGYLYAINNSVPQAAPTWNTNPVNESDATEGAAYSSTLADDASDVNNDPLTFAKVSGPAWLTVAANGTLSGTPGTTDVGLNTWTVSVSDGIAAAVETTLNITVTTAPVNTPPTWTSNPVNEADAREGAAYSSTLADEASDVDSDPLTFARVSGPTWLTVAANGTVSGTPGTADVGGNTWTVSVSDGINSPVQATLNITVSAVGAAVTYEAEDAVISGAIIGRDNGGYSGTGYVDYQGAIGDYIEWTVTRAGAGSCTLEFAYANGSNGDRPLEIRVNGQVVDAGLSFAPSGNWATWVLTAPLTVQLAAGVNTIRATAIGSSGGNVDYLQVTGTAPAYVPADFEPDGDVDIHDLAVLAAEWLQTENLTADIYPPGSGDGIVDLRDFAEFAKYWQSVIE